MVVVKTFFSRAEAEVLRLFLADNDIHAVILADDQGGLRPSLAFASGVKLLIHEQDIERTRELLESIENDSDE